VLDWMNTYGMRWLVPFSAHWYYGDALFIVDPVLWIALTAAVVVTRRRHGAAIRGPSSSRPRPWVTRPARWGLVLATAYVILMVVAGRVARASVFRTLADRGVVPSAVMAAPEPGNPLERRVVYVVGDEYRVATHHFLRSPALSLEWTAVPRRDTAELVERVRATPQGAEFLSWARFPYYHVTARGDSADVFVGDARYTTGTQPSWASVRVTVPLN
jgi:inner membrane protein